LILPVLNEPNFKITLDKMGFLCYILVGKYKQGIQGIQDIQGGVLMLFGKLDYQKSEFLYLQIATMIESRILNNKIKVGQKIPTVRELCATFKVSLPTIRDAIGKLTEEGYLSKRRSLGTFVVNSKPKKGIDLKEKNEIALIFCKKPGQEDLQNIYFYRIIRGVENKVKEKNGYLLFVTFDKSESNSYLEGKKETIAGIIVMGRILPERFKIIKRTQMPYVLIGDLSQKTRTDEKVDIIGNDDFQGIYLATRHLTGLGHKKILYVRRNWGYFYEEDSLKGYKQALKDADIAYDRNLHIEIGSSGDINDVYSASKKILRKPKPFSAVVCSATNCISGLLRALREKNLRIPEDISMVSVSSTEFTAMQYDPLDMGKAAVERLYRRLNNPNCPPERTIVPYKLIDRGSTRRI
jgi:DNA-binding LacI/PurR family transcriptional regulator